MKNLIIFSLLILSLGCKESVKEIKASFAAISEKKQAMQNELGQFSPSEESLEIVQPFFDQSFNLLVDLLDQLDPKQTLVSVMKFIGPAQFCEKAIMSKEDWLKLDSLCRTQSTYLCSEEIRSLPDLYRRLFFEAPNEIKVKINQNSICKSWNLEEGSKK